MTTAAQKEAGIRQRLAGASPRVLLRTRVFWEHQRGFAAAIGFSVLTVILLAPYTYAVAGGWERLLVLVVQALAVLGGVVTARSLAQLDVESAIVTEIEFRGTEYLRDIKTGAKARIDLDHLEDTILPTNRTNPPPAMIRLFQHICKEARDRKFDSSVQVMQPYREEPLEEIFKLQNLQKVALWLGILGTFIGLLITLMSAELQKLLQGNLLVQMVNEMLQGLIVSFSASLAGLQVAVILGVFILLLRHRQERYFKAMETAVVTMLSLARNALNTDDFVAEFGQINTAVTNLAERVVEQSRELAATQTQIRTGMTRLAETGVAFDGFLARIGEAQNEFITDIKGIYDTISLKNLASTVSESVGRGAQLMGDKFAIGTNQIDQRLIAFNESVAKLSESLVIQARETAETNQKLGRQITTTNAESLDAIRAVTRQITELLSREAASTNTARAEMQELSRKIGELSRAVTKIEILTPRRRSIWEALTSLRSGS